MSNWLFNLPVLGMGAVILGAVWLVTAGIYLAVTALATGERARAFKTISPGILPPLAILFALLLGFLAVQDWGDIDRAHGAVNREASSLRAVVLLTPAPFRASLRHGSQLWSRATSRTRSTGNGLRVARGDATLPRWPLLGSPRPLRLALTLEPKGEGQTIAQREMIGALESALDARRQRHHPELLVLNWVKWSVLLLQAGLTLVTIAMIHCDNRLGNRLILGIFSTGVGLALTLLASHTRPFSGDIAVTPAVLLQVMPEAANGQ